jgi:hypothetical protein
MRITAHHRFFARLMHALAPVFLVLALIAIAAAAHAQSAPDTQSVVHDRVLVVVNQQPILQSDLDRELRLSILDPNLEFAHRPAPTEVLDRLISRALIKQQFAGQPPMDQKQLQKDVDLRKNELRTEVPACVRLNCKTEPGWKAFLDESHLTTAEIDVFIREQLLILDFIEKRFRPGIHITPEQVEDYYKKSLLPQYSNPALAPTLEAVAPRIAEVLLEQEVNLLLEDWLTTLRKEGDLEFLDHSLESLGQQGGAK